MIAELEDRARQVIERTGPAVVRVGRDGRGSGLVSGDGLVVTNAHNLRGREVSVTFADGRAVTATVAAADVDHDLAVLRVDTAGLAAPDWADAEAARPGTVVFALAGGPSGTRISFGMVSAVARSFAGPRGRRIRGGIEHTAPLPRGSSGGPLLGSDGRVLGINTHRVAEGLYLAQPSGPDLRSRLDDLAAGTAPVRRTLGVAIAPAGLADRLRRSVGLEPAPGLLVRAVVEGSPAEEAGIAKGDLLQRAGAAELAVADDLHDALDAVGEDGAVEVGLLRGTTTMTVTVRLVTAEEAPPS